MTEALLVGVLAAWMAEALALGYVVGRQGYDALAGTGIALFLGPLAVGIAGWFAHQSPSRVPKLLHAGRPRSGAVDVLVGMDVSPEWRASVERVLTAVSAAHSVATGLARRAGIPVLLVDDAGESTAAPRRLREVV